MPHHRMSLKMPRDPVVVVVPAAHQALEALVGEGAGAGAVILEPGASAGAPPSQHQCTGATSDDDPR